MVSKTTLKAYNFETIEDYYEYIVQSKIVGQYKQVESLIKAMSKEQKKDCLNWFNQQYVSNDLEICKKELIEQL